MAVATGTYEIHLPQFEGPFDLLLFFIERDELDIYDIPIADITKEFLTYISEMQALDVDLASEFILVASTLMRIKAKMLLPRKELDEEGNEIDPREDLVQALLEYKRYKEVVGTLQQWEAERHMTHPRPVQKSELKKIADAFETDTDLSNLTLYKLMRTFQNVLDRIESRKEALAHQIVPYPYTVDHCKDDLLGRLEKTPRLDFEAAFGSVKERVEAVFLFSGHARPGPVRLPAHPNRFGLQQLLVGVHPRSRARAAPVGFGAGSGHGKGKR